MHSFKDNRNRTWAIELNVDAVKRVKGLLDVDLMTAPEGELVERLAGDPVLLCDVIYAVCKPQAEGQGIGDEDFGKAMAGDAIDAATTALLEELVDFFPTARRAVLRKTLAKVRKLEAMALDAAGRVLDSDKLERAMEAELAETDTRMEALLASARTSGSSSGSSPASPASSPVHSPCGS